MRTTATAPRTAFYADPRVLFVSLHQWPLYPGTGRATETGTGGGVGTTLNLPMPAGATGDVYLRRSTRSSPRWWSGSRRPGC